MLPRPTNNKMKKKIYTLLVAALTVSLGAVAQTIERLTTEYLATPIGIDVAQPQFAWQMKSDRYGAAQTAYRLVVAESQSDLLTGKFVYDTGKKLSDVSVGIKYEGAPLKPSTRYYWRVTVTDEKKRDHVSSATWFETGLMGGKWDGAQWIASPLNQVSPFSADYVLEYDVKSLGKPGPATFVFGEKSEQDYCYVTLDTRQPARFKAGMQLHHKTLESQDIDVSDIIKAESDQPHHVKLTVYCGWSSYIVSASVDGHQFKTAGGKTSFNINSRRDTSGRRDNFLYRIGYCQPEGFSAQFSNIAVSNQKWNVCLATDTTTHHAQGDGKLNTWVFNPDVYAPQMRKVVNLSKTVSSARLYATARGIYNFYINGQKAGDAYMAPGWTDVRHRIMYDTYDVTSMLTEGPNALALEIGNGWFSGYWGWAGSKWSDQYGYKPSAMAMLRVTYTDGTTESFVTGSDWKVTTSGPLFVDNFYHGVVYDARREIEGWKEVSFDDSAWRNVAIAPAPADSVVLQGYVGMKIRNNITLHAQSVKKIGDRYIYDMGQNFAGVPRLKNLHGKAGQQIVIHFAEMLFPDQVPEKPRAPLTKDDYAKNRGQMYMDNYRSALSTDYYTFKGDPAGETFEPPFTQHGYRYLSIDGIDTPPALSDVEGIVLESVGEQLSTYESANADINKLFNNIVWGQRSNFLAVPTDCPQRDERLGWTGDANIFCRTATYNMMTEPFYKRWFYTVRDQKSLSGDTGGYYPVMGTTSAGADNDHVEAATSRGCGWSDFTVIIPWQMYQQYGDKEFIREHYASMKAFMQRLEAQTTDCIYPNASHWGDWVAPVYTKVSLLTTAFFGYDARIMSEMARVLGYDADAQYYAALHQRISQAFCRNFFDSEGYTVNNDGKGTRINTQTSYILPLEFLDIPDTLKQKAVQRLCDKIHADGNRIQTGFLGTPYILNVLSDNGCSDLAYTLYTQTEYPSWLFPVKQGATTMWERWNSYTIKEGFGDVGMNSFNHYAYGAVEEWIMSHNLGIQRDEARPAYKHIVLQPKVNRSFGWVRGGFESVYGPISSQWRATDDATDLAFTIPANTTATLVLPVGSEDDLKVLTGKKGVVSRDYSGGRAVLQLKSGSYTFRCKRQDN